MKANIIKGQPYCPTCHIPNPISAETLKRDNIRTWRCTKCTSYITIDWETPNVVGGRRKS